MRFRWLPVILGVAALASVNAAARGEVLNGTATLLPYYMPGCECGWDQAFDFSAASFVPLNSASADLSFSENPRCCVWYWYVPHASVLYYLAESIETLQTVPATGTFYDTIQNSGTYVLKTGDAYWVKFAVRNDMPWLTIEYYLQTDGSRYFGPTLAVESSTWGRVKALYR